MQWLQKEMQSKTRQVSNQKENGERHRHQSFLDCVLTMKDLILEITS
jgi:hypothetical protein